MQKTSTESVKKILSIGIVWLTCLLLSGCGQISIYSQRNKNAPPKVGKSPDKRRKKNMDAEANYPTANRETAYKQLESYIFELQYGRKVEPRNLRPENVEEFIREKVDRSKQPASFGRTRSVIDFYDLTSVLDHFEKMLDRSEKDDRELLQSVEITRMMGEQGTPEQQKKALEYHNYLVKSPLAEKNFNSLTEAIDSFSNFSPSVLTEAMKKQYPILKERGKDYIKGNSDATYLNGLAEEIFTLQNGLLPQFSGALQARQAILNTASPTERIEKLTLVYLEQEPVPSPQWAARQMRREAREGKTATIIDALRKSFRGIKAKKYDEARETAYLLRAARAVRFFGAATNDEENQLIKNGSEYQIDFLDRDFYKVEEK